MGFKLKIEIFVYNKFKTFYKIDIRDDIKDIIHYSDNISRCDLSSQEKTEEFLQSKIFDDVDILINCAGIFFLKNITKTTKKDYNLMMNVQMV